MTDPLRDRIQASLGTAYRLERELGGGGMSRVFVATETALGRQVVVKVLSPELAAGVSVERFKREIHLAARLQHANIVPLHAAGEVDGLPYYTMPYVEGESLRARLAQGGALPLGEVVAVLRDVTRALGYAHERGVVHRDIKPDNVLLAGGAAVVTDFGIAKALSAARAEAPNATDGGALTFAGTSIGTPAYMAPEQAAGDPSADHRADVYALGVLAYEMLGGRTPFHGRTPQKLLAAHMGERPEPIARHRADCPPALAALVMRCLEKEPSDRPQSALEVIRQLDAVGTPGGATGGEAAIIGGAPGRPLGPALGRALGLYAAAFVVVALVARAAVTGIGLPSWVFPGALFVMALGLPVLLVTGLVHHQARVARTAAVTRTPGGSPAPASTLSRLAVRARPHVTWRRAALGGVVAIWLFTLGVAGFMTLRALGIGPAGSLIARGVIGEKERLLVADFRSPASDTTLGPVVTEAFRTELAQSPSVVVVPATGVRDVLRRMQRLPDSRVDLTLAREVATREGVKAIVDGEVLALGGKYVLSARLIATQSGDQLATFRETADDQGEIIPAIDRLSKSLRERIGESLRSVRATPPLERVTTGSLEALKKYAQGVRAIEVQGDFARAIALLEEAVALDTAFAMAYRKLAIELGNRGLQPRRSALLLEKAYAHRDRLSDRERYMTEGSYWMRGPKPDRAKAITAYEALVEAEPDYTPALNNLALLYRQLRQQDKAEQALLRATSQGASAVRLGNLASVRMNLGKTADAHRAVDSMAAATPGNPVVAFMRAELLTATHEYDRAAHVLDSLRRARPEASTQSGAAAQLGDIALVRGQLARALELYRAAAQARGEMGDPRAALNRELDEAWMAVWFLADSTGALRKVREALVRHPIDSIPLEQRPYGYLLNIYALAGERERARAMLDAWERSREIPRLGDEETRRSLRGLVAFAARRYDEALRDLRVAGAGICLTCALGPLAMVHDVAGNADSALVYYERYVRTPHSERLQEDGAWLAGAYKRLGELYEARNQPGDREKAASTLAKFVELWKDADPALQPRVREARERLARLQPGGK